jgi:hypothetical protein
MNDVDKVKRGEALEQLKQHQGYKALVKLFQELYNDCLQRLIDHEDEDARHMIKALTNVLEEIDKSIILSDDLKSQFKDFVEK